MLALYFSLVSSYNIWRGDCQAIIDTYKYDLTRFINKTTQIFQNPDKTVTYYLRPCHEYSAGSTADTFLMRCTKSKCEHIITQNSLNYKPRNPNNFSEGLIYFADSEPFSDDGGRTYQTLDLQFDLICDPTIPDPDIDFAIILDESSTGSLIARARTAAACPATVPSPSPTPTYDIDCTYVDRIDNNLTYGIDGDLATLNGGPYGAKATIMVNGEERVLYYQACERMECPPLYECSSNSYSSAWLCDSKTFKCDSYGVITHTDFTPIDSSDLYKGMQLLIQDPESNRATNLTLTCEEVTDYPDGHIDFSKLASITDNTLFLSGAADELCIRRIPTATPQPRGICQFESISTSDGKISMNLADLNRGNIGYAKDVQVTGLREHPNAVLRYQPCGSMVCPPDTFCFGDEDAEIWLCYKDDDGIQTCDGYGLYKNNVSISLFMDDDVTGGVQAKYRGDMKRQADIIINCNKDLPENTVELPDSVSISGRILSVFIQSRAACPISDSDDTDDSGGKSITGGAIFLIIVCLAAVLYISIGLIYNFVKEGKVQFPNQTFWTIFGECIVLAVNYIFRCGRTGPVAFQSKYDQI